MSKDDFSKLIVESQAKPFTVTSVQVKGATYTNDSLFETLTRPLFEAKTLGDVIIGTRNVGDQLKRLDIFDQVSITLDSLPGSSEFVNVIYHVQEKKRLFAQTGLSAGNYQGSAV